MNPMDMLKGMVGKMNPKSIAMNILKNSSNPICSNLLQMAEKGDTKGIEQFAKNVCKEKGIDFDKQFNEFMSNFKN